MRIGDYEIYRLLGKGGMSEVYEAEHVRVGSRHALKSYSYSGDSDDARRRFEQEGRLLARLDHPRIVKVTDFGTDAATGRPYFVMTLVADADGVCRSLADVPAAELDEEHVGRWYDDVRAALAYVHAKGIVHRDLKLQNVLIGPDGHAVLTDFGISRVFAPEGGEPAVAPVDTVLRVRDGKSMVMGSVGYMAPELELGVAASAQSDWYALGVIVYRLLTGTWCDARTDVVAALETYDPVWTRILPKLLHSNPAGRACLGYAEEKEALRQDAETEFENLRRHKRRRRFVRRWTAIGGAAALLMLAGVAAWQWDQLRARRAQACAFENLFVIPEAAGEEEDEDRRMPSRSQFEAARVDACVLTQPLLAEFRAGNIKKPALKIALGRMMLKAQREDEGVFGDVPDFYTPSHEFTALALLFRQAANKVSQ